MPLPVPESTLPPSQFYTTQEDQVLRIDPVWQCTAANAALDWARLTRKISREALEPVHAYGQPVNSVLGTYGQLFFNYIANYALAQQLKWQEVIQNPFACPKDNGEHEIKLRSLLRPEPDFGPTQTPQDRMELTLFQFEQHFQSDMAALYQDATTHVRQLIKHDAPFLMQADKPAVQLFMTISADIQDAGMLAMSQIVGATPLCPTPHHKEAFKGFQTTTKALSRLFSTQMTRPPHELPPLAQPLYLGYLRTGLRHLSQTFNALNSTVEPQRPFLAGALLSAQGLVQTASLERLKNPRGEGAAASYTDELSVLITTLTHHVKEGRIDRAAQDDVARHTSGSINTTQQASETDIILARNAAHHVFTQALQQVDAAADKLSGYQRPRLALPTFRDHAKPLQ